MKKETIDFTGVPEDIKHGGSYVPPGDYLAKIVKVEKKWKDDDKSNVPYFAWQFTITTGSHKGTTLYFITSLKTEALFNLRNLIHAATSKNFAGKKLAFDPENLLGKVIAVTTDDDEYQGKLKTRVVDVRPKDELNPPDDEDEDEDEEEAEEEDEEDLEEVDVDEL